MQSDQNEKSRKSDLHIIDREKWSLLLFIVLFSRSFFFYSVINFLSFTLSLFISFSFLFYVYMLLFFLVVLISEQAPMSRSIFVVRWTNRQIDREEKKKKWESKLECSLLMNGETYIYIYICTYIYIYFIGFHRHLIASSD